MVWWTETGTDESGGRVTRGHVVTRILPVVLAVALFTAACSSGNVDGLAPIDGPEDSTTTTAQTTTSAPKEAEDEVPAVDPADAEAAVSETWTALLEASSSGVPSADQLEIIASLSDDDTTAQLESFFPEAPAREITFYSKLTPQEDGTVAIDDCIVMNRGISTGFSNWLIGQADQDADSPTGWIITNVQLINLEPCVPSSIADAAIEGYEAHLDAFDQIFDPPDPEAAALFETATGQHLTFFQDLASDLRAAGQVVRGRATTFPEFFEVTSPTAVTIIDCQEIPTDYGVYDEATGERTDVIPPIVEDQLNLQEADMALDDGVWKVSEFRGATNSQCRTPPLYETVQIAGG